MPFNLFQISALITTLASVIFGSWVYFKGEKTKLAFSWLLTSLFVGLWSLGLFGVTASADRLSAWTWQFVLDVGGILTPIMFFSFILNLTKNQEKLRKLKNIFYFLGLLLVGLSFTPLFKTGVSPKFGINFWIDSGPLYFLFPLFFLVMATASFAVLIIEYKNSVDKNFRRQVIYVLMAGVFAFSGGLTDFFPQLFNVYPFGNYFVILYIIFISYATMQYHLFNIGAMAMEILIFMIWLILLIRTIFSDELAEFGLNSFILGAVGLMGILLIRGVTKIERMNADVQKAYITQKEANLELQRLDEAKSQFMVITQHHLRTPLTATRWYLDLLASGQAGKLPKKAAETVQKLKAATEGEIKIVDDLLNVSQYQLNKEIVDIKPGVDIKQMLSQIIADVTPQAQEKNISVVLMAQENLPAIPADESKLKVALENIVDNAVKYTEKGGVDVSVKEEGKNILIAVKDTGIGMDEEDKKRAFYRTFERGENAKKLFATGKGIGLYLTAEIIKDHNGKVRVESDGLGKGSTFFVELPIR